MAATVSVFNPDGTLTDETKEELVEILTNNPEVAERAYTDLLAILSRPNGRSALAARRYGEQ